MIIQSAAHEDANMIFGAVMDESLGEEIKITVIATGFRHETPQRRERMMRPAAVTVNAGDGPAPKARFASEMAEEDDYTAAPHTQAEEMHSFAAPPAAMPHAPTYAEEPEPARPEPARHPAHTEDLFARAVVAAPVAAPEFEAEDQLDIPAFLRKNSTE